MRKTKIYERRDKFDIEFLWIQLEEVIEHGNEKDAKTKFELLAKNQSVSGQNDAKEQARKEAISELTLSRKSVR